MKQTQERLTPPPIYGVPETHPWPAWAAGLLGLFPLFLSLGLLCLCFALGYNSFLQQPLSFDRGWVQGLGPWSGRRALLVWCWNTGFIGLTALFAAYCAGLAQGLSAARALLTPASVAALIIAPVLALGLTLLSAWALLLLPLVGMVGLLLFLSLGIAGHTQSLGERLHRPLWVASFAVLLGLFFVAGGNLLLAPPLGISLEARALSPATTLLFSLLWPVALVLGFYGQRAVPPRLCARGASPYVSLGLVVMIFAGAGALFGKSLHQQTERQAELETQIAQVKDSLKLASQQRWPRLQKIQGSAQERYAQILSSSRPSLVHPRALLRQRQAGRLMPDLSLYQNHLREIQTLQLAVHSADFELKLHNAQLNYKRALDYAQIWVAAAQAHCQQKRQRAGMNALVQTMQMGEDLLMTEFSPEGALVGQEVYALPLRYWDRCMTPAPQLAQQRFVLEQSRQAWEYRPSKHLDSVMKASKISSLDRLLRRTQTQLQRQRRHFNSLFAAPLMQNALHHYLEMKLPEDPRQFQAWVTRVNRTQNPHLKSLGQDLEQLIQEMQFTATLAGGRYFQAALERYFWLYKRYPSSLHGVQALMSEEPRDMRSGERFVYTLLSPTQYRLETVGTGPLREVAQAKAGDRLRFRSPRR